MPDAPEWIPDGVRISIDAALDDDQHRADRCTFHARIRWLDDSLAELLWRTPAAVVFVPAYVAFIWFLPFGFRAGLLRGPLDGVCLLLQLAPAGAVVLWLAWPVLQLWLNHTHVRVVDGVIRCRHLPIPVRRKGLTSVALRDLVRLEVAQQDDPRRPWAIVGVTEGRGFGTVRVVNRLATRAQAELLVERLERHLTPRVSTKGADPW